MKIGIITWFSYYNYGTVLQASALLYFLNENGNVCELILYVPDNSEKIKKLSYIESVKRITGRIRRRMNPDIVEKTCLEEFELFKQEMLRFSQRSQTEEELRRLNNCYDAFICGSDQIWSPNWFDARYFLDFVDDENKIIAYAPSIGVVDIDDQNVSSKMAKLIKRFHYLSVREIQGARVIKKITHKDARVVADPTLLLDREEWQKKLDIHHSEKDKYVLAYFLGTNETYWKIVNRIAKRLRAKLIIIPVHKKDLYRKGTVCKGVGPRRFVELLLNASYICTDSFHGTAFSINFNKDFCVFERFGRNCKINQNSRIYSLLEMMHLNKRIYKKGRLESLLQAINYNDINPYLIRFREESKSYLLSSMEHVSLQKQKDHKLEN